MKTDSVLPIGEKNEAPQPSEPMKTVSIDSVIESSKTEIAAAQEKPRRRGRPPKHGKYSKFGSKNEAPSGLSAPPPTGLTEGAGPEAAPAMDLTPMLSGVIRMPFDIAAAKYRCNEISLTDSEATEPAALANQLLNAYLPEVMAQDPKRILTWSLALSLGMLTVKKMSIYVQVKSIPRTPAAESSPAAGAPLPKEPEKPATETASEPAPPLGQVSAFQAYRDTSHRIGWNV